MTTAISCCEFFHDPAISYLSGLVLQFKEFSLLSDRGFLNRSWHCLTVTPSQCDNVPHVRRRRAPISDHDIIPGPELVKKNIEEREERQEEFDVL